jgi:hypothetical protein
MTAPALRAGLTVAPDSPRANKMRLAVKLDSILIGVVFDESLAKLERGGFCAWSARCRNKGGIVGFYPTKEEAAEAIAELFAKPGPEGTTSPADATERAAFLSLSTERRDAIARNAARIHFGTVTVAEAWTKALRIDAQDHPGADPETGEPVHVRTNSGQARHMPNPDRTGRRTLCGDTWQLPSWYLHEGKIHRPDHRMILGLPECAGCARSHAARQAAA